MKIIGTKTHGYLDYIVGLFLIAAPWLLGFAGGGAKTWVPVILGAGAILYSLVTDYELGVKKIISMRTHLTLDLVSGIVLASSPWVFDFADAVSTPHLLLGLLEIVVSLLTVTHPVRNRNPSTMRTS